MQVPTKIKRGAFLKAQTGKSTVNFHESQERKSTGQSLKSTWETLCQRDWCLKDRNPIPWIHFPMKGYRKQRAIYLHSLPILSSTLFFPTQGSNLKTSNLGTIPPYRILMQLRKISQDSLDPGRKSLFSWLALCVSYFLFLFKKNIDICYKEIPKHWTLSCEKYQVGVLKVCCHGLCLLFRPPRACIEWYLLCSSIII